MRLIRDWRPRRAGLRAGIVGARRATGCASAKAGSPRRGSRSFRRSSRRPTGISARSTVKATTDDERRKAVESRPDCEEVCRPHDGAGRVGPRRPRGGRRPGLGGEVRRADQGSRPGHRASGPRTRAGSQGYADRQHARPIACRRPPSACCAPSPRRAPIAPCKSRAAFALARLLNNEAELRPPGEAE